MSVVSFQKAARERSLLSPPNPDSADKLGCVMFTSAELHGLALLRSYEQGLFKDVTLTASGQSAAYHFRQIAQEQIFMSIGKIRNGQGFGYTLAMHEESSILVDDFKTVVDLARAEVEALARSVSTHMASDDYAVSL